MYGDGAADRLTSVAEQRTATSCVTRTHGWDTNSNRTDRTNYPGDAEGAYMTKKRAVLRGAWPSRLGLAVASLVFVEAGISLGGTAWPAAGFGLVMFFYAATSRLVVTDREIRCYPIAPGPVVKVDLGRVRHVTVDDASSLLIPALVPSLICVAPDAAASDGPGTRVPLTPLLAWGVLGGEAAVRRRATLLEELVASTT